MRYAPRLIAPGSAPDGAFVEPLIVDPPKSPLGEHEVIPQIAWMVERDGTFVHVTAADAPPLELMRGSAELTKLDGTLTNETLDDLPGINLATHGEYAAELFLDGDHLTALHDILAAKIYLAAAPRRGRFLVGGIRGGIAGMRSFLDRVRREYDDAPPLARISPVALLVRAAAPTAVVGDLQLAALAHAAGQVIRSAR